MKKLFALMLISIFLLTACTGSSIVGTWSGAQDGITTTMTFGKDGTYSIGVLGLTMKGTYTVKGDQLTITMIDPFFGQETTETSTFRITGDTMELDGGTLKRVR